MNMFFLGIYSYENFRISGISCLILFLNLISLSYSVPPLSSFQLLAPESGAMKTNKNQSI